MPPTRYTESPDGLQIAYDVQGQGPPLILLHGMSGDRQRWHAYGVVAAFSETYTVITLDFRGCGASQSTHYASDYSAALHMQDVLAVADAAGAERFRLWGWSLGATLASHLASHSDRIERMVMAGTFFGPIFTPEWLQQQMQAWEPLALAKAEGRLESVSDSARSFVERTDFEVFFARLHGVLEWPPIWPEDLQCPTTVYTGSLDGRVFSTLETQRERILAAGHQLYIMPGFNHVQLIMETPIVIPTVKAFLAD